MAKYVTLQQFYLAEDSVPNLAGIPTSIVNRAIQRAESLIDAYVGFDVRFGGFEPHSAFYVEPFDQETLKIRIPNFPVPARLVDRYRIHVANQANGDGFYATINTGDCVINQFAGYIEIVPLQAITYSATPFMLGLGLQPPLVTVDFEAGFYLPAWADQFEDVYGDLTSWRAPRGFWATSYNTASYLKPNTPPAVPPVIYVDGVVQTGNYTITSATEGIITFNTALTPHANGSAPIVTGDYCYQIPDPIRDAAIAQVRDILLQRNLNLMGLGGIEVARSRDQQIKRHIRTSSGNSAKDEPAVCVEAMQLLEPYTYIPGA